MKLPVRLALLLTALTATAVSACAPQTSGGSPSGADETSGTLRVWLFQEVGNQPKEQVVDAVLAGFEKDHEGTDVTVEYIPVETRAQRVKAAFNDPASAPDVIEYGNTDTAGYVADGGLADVTAEFGAWSEAKDTDPTARRSVTVDGKVYGAPFFVGVRALYYRTDLFRRLGLEPPRSLAELTTAAREIRAAEPGLYGLAVGGAYTYGALPFLWAHGGDVTDLDSAASRAGVEAYTGLFGDDNCPAAKCAGMGGNDTVTAFAAGKAGMAIGGDFSHQAVEAGKVKGKYAVVPLPGVRPGSVAPAFAGGNNIGVLKSTSHRTLAVDLMKRLASKETQGKLFEAMGFLPTFEDVRDDAAAKEPFVRPFVKTLEAGTEFVPVSPGWAAVDSGAVLPTMYQRVVSGRETVAAATGDAAREVDEALGDAR
ncbi:MULTISPECIES: extracellular solute-binding protein [Streptomyces]|uniref:N,N'-diacetylchitobiose transport system substrate-binding protein n=2 Tax=Streptomyces TaxID=1883 RepID=A0ABT9LEE4_STRGD|nr:MULTISPECIES: extracellular solute-binding protein [Streptomyces]MDP9682090.1 N,N'-diacetylchitobiose transport system substrate-binding protein [Streptomyces griseoviridis]GGT02538.1 ABC transporter substrate-binding protein [Streptomyces griseoviridis]GGU34814.1 ABC transporter substrate-binding protein [Streptomyces daghestanicus]GHI33910.1 ABC transporter substrate-binding protein [Streptomyces daghestanicus]